MTEPMFFPPPGVKYKDADLSPTAVDGGKISFTKTFELLGSMLAYDLKDNDMQNQKCSRSILGRSNAILQCKRNSEFAQEDCL